MRRSAWILGAVAWLVGSAGPAAAQYLTQGSPPPEAGSQGALPDWLSGIVGWVIAMQERFYDGLAARIGEVEASGAMSAVLAVLALSFLYGVFHAVGPGHGKAVVASYFLAHRSRYWRGAALGAAIAAVQGLSAIAIVTGLGLVLGMNRGRMLQEWPLLEMASYGLIVVLGTVMLIGVATGRGCCHEGHEHDHEHDHHHHEHPGGSEGRRRPGLMQAGVLQIAVAVGLRPCTGALIVLLFSLANGLFLLGVAGVVAMAAGVAVTISLMGMGVIGARRGLVAVLGPQSRVATFGRTGLQIAGSLMILLVGLLLFIGSWQRTGLPLF